MVTRLAVALAFQTVILAFSFLMSERLICAVYISDESSGLLL
jgi:hypothetical protein